MLDEVDEAALVLERDLLLALRTLVLEDDLQATVEERHRLQPLEHGAGHELGALGEEDRGIRPERDGGTGRAARAGVDPTISILPWGLPPLAYSWR